MKNVEVFNSKGELVTLTAREETYAAQMQRQFDEKFNALGIEVNMTSLTTILKGVIDQVFYTIKPSLYIPITVGEGAWSTNLLTYTSTLLSGDFETGIINAGGNNSRLASAEAGVEPLTTPVYTWAKEVSWTIAELQFATKANQWDVITAKEKARKTNWDLGIQKIAFLGSASGTLKGLLNQTSVTIDASFITTPIKSMNAAQFQAFVAGLISRYRTAVSFTQMPDRFYIPEQDYTGLGAAADEAFGLRSKLERLLEAFRAVTMNPDFQILPLVYAAQTNNSLGKNRYVLMKYDPENVRMDIPVDYTTTVQGTVNGFQHTNVGYGQFTGVQARRPKTIMYFDYVGVIL